MPNEFIQDLERRLISDAFSKEEMIDLAKRLAPLEELEPEDIFPVGTVRPDVLRVKYDLTAGELSALTQRISQAEDFPIRKLSIFPLGTVVPERFLMEVDIASRLD